jgi:hypothetical protein
LQEEVTSLEAQVEVAVEMEDYDEAEQIQSIIDSKTTEIGRLQEALKTAFEEEEECQSQDEQLSPKNKID